MIDPDTPYDLTDLVDPAPGSFDRVPIVHDEADNVLAWMDHGRLEALGAGDRLAADVGDKVGIDILEGQAGRRQILVTDREDVLAWTQDGLLDGIGLGPSLLANLRARLHTAPDDAHMQATTGLGLRKHRAAIANLARASTRSVRHHIWLTGDSWTQRTAIPDAIKADYAALGCTIVATGWVSIGNSVIAVNATVSEVDMPPRGGLYGPDGFRVLCADGTTTAQLSMNFTGRYLRLYHKQNAAAFSYRIDGGAVISENTGSGGGTGRTIIDCGEDRAHSIVITRPVATNDLEFYGAFASSDLAGLTISVAGNSGSTMADIAAALATTSAQMILADISSIVTTITMRFCWLTNDSRTGLAVTGVAASCAGILSAYQTAFPQMEGYFVVPPANAVAGLTAGIGIGHYIPGILAACDTRGFDLVNFWAILPAHADCIWFWTDAGIVDSLHLSAEGGGCQFMVQQERHHLNWEII